MTESVISLAALIEYGFIFLGLVLGVAAHILKKVIQQRENDKTFSLKRYLTENPYKTAMVVFYAGAGAAGLHLDGSLSIYTAMVTGFTANSLSGKSDG